MGVASVWLEQATLAPEAQILWQLPLWWCLAVFGLAGFRARLIRVDGRPAQNTMGLGGGILHVKLMLELANVSLFVLGVKTGRQGIKM